MTDNYFAAIFQGLGNYCNVLHNDGVSYRDHVEQLTSIIRRVCARRVLRYTLSIGCMPAMKMEVKTCEPELPEALVLYSK